MALFLGVGSLILAFIEQIEGLLHVVDRALRQPLDVLVDYLEVDRTLPEGVVDLLVVDLEVGDID